MDLNKRLNFLSIKTFIDTVIGGVFPVVNGVTIYAPENKDLFIKICGVQYFIDENAFDEYKIDGKLQINDTNVDQIYEKATNLLAPYQDKISHLTEIIKMCDESIEYRKGLLFKSKEYSFTDVALSNLLDKLSDIADNLSTMDTTEMFKVVKDIKENVNADDLVKSMIDNGLIKKPTKKGGKKVVIK
jgi:hypothetical protein